MSDDRPSGSNPFEFLMGDMMKAMGSQAQDPIAMVTQFAQVANTDTSSTANVEPTRRIALENLYRVATLHVGQLNFLPPSFMVESYSLNCVNPATFASESIAAWSPYIQALLNAMTPPPGTIMAQPETDGAPEASLMSMLGQFGATLSPMLSGAQLGSLIGHFSGEALGDYDIPIPRPNTHEISLVDSAVTSFASEWQVNEDSLALWLMVHELAMAAVLSVPEILDRLDTEIRLHLADMRADVSNALGKLSELNLADPAALTGLLGDPSALMSGDLTPAQKLNYEDIEATLAVLHGVATFACRKVGDAVLGTDAVIEEATYRRSLEPSEPKRLIGHLLGVQTSTRALELSRSLADFLGEGDNARVLMVVYRDPEAFPTIFDLENLSLWFARVAPTNEIES